jgi:hypothetical protein
VDPPSSLVGGENSKKSNISFFVGELQLGGSVMGSGLISPLRREDTLDSASGLGDDDFNDFYPIKYQNTLRLNILEHIPLKFVRPTNVLLYGSSFSHIEHMAQFLSEKLECPITRGGLRTAAGMVDGEAFPELSHQNLFVNSPATFQELLALKTATPDHEIVAIFIRCQLRRLHSRIKQNWIHPSSGRTYNTLLLPPKSMTGTLEDPLTMLDDVTSEPLQQVITTEDFFRQIRAYDAIRSEMWPHLISFRYAVDGDTTEEVAKSTLVHLLSTVIAHQPPASIRVVGSDGTVRIVTKSQSVRKSLPRER